MFLLPSEPSFSLVTSVSLYILGNVSYAAGSSHKATLCDREQEVMCTPQVSAAWRRFSGATRAGPPKEQMVNPIRGTPFKGGTCPM